MTEEVKQLLNSSFLLNQLLSNVLPKEAVDYIINLVVLDQAHQRYSELTSDAEDSN